MLVREWAHLLAVDGNRTDRLIVLQHRNRKYCAGASELGVLGIGIARWHIEIMRLVHHISDLRRLFCRQRASKRCCWSWSNHWILTPLLHVWLRGAMQRDGPKGIAFAQPKIAKFGTANSYRVFQHRLEHRLQFAWRRANDFKHLRGRRLLLQRLGKLARTRLHLVEQ